MGAGAEVISDGSIHIYGTLRGRALAGAQGNTDARIFCREFHAELVAIAGHYKVLEDVPKELRGKAVQIWLGQAGPTHDCRPVDLLRRTMAGRSTGTHPPERTSRR